MRTRQKEQCAARGARGFTIIEVVAAAAVMVIVFIAIGGLFDKSNRALGEVSQSTNTEIVLQRMLERIGNEIRQVEAANVSINTAPATYDALRVVLPTKTIDYTVSGTTIERLEDDGTTETTAVAASNVREPGGGKAFTTSWSETTKTFTVRAHLMLPGREGTAIYRVFTVQATPRL